MIQIPVQAKIFALPFFMMPYEPLDNVIAVCKKNGFDPFSGDIFVFRSEDSKHIGLLIYDGHGFQWCMKRFSEGKLAWWPDDFEVAQILPRDLQIMIWGGNPELGMMVGEPNSNRRVIGPYRRPLVESHGYGLKRKQGRAWSPGARYAFPDFRISG